MMKSSRLAGAGLALGMAFGTTACTTTGSIVPKVINTNEVIEEGGQCIIRRERGFDPGILLFLGFNVTNATERDAVCITRDTVQQIITDDDMFLRTVGYEAYKLLPQDAQERVQQYLVLNGTNIENIAASVPQVDRTVTNCAGGYVNIYGHMPDGEQKVLVKPIVAQSFANQNAGLTTQSPPPVQTFQCPAQP